MYRKINITENHLQVLSLFTKGFNKEYHIREVAKLLTLSPRSAQLMLADFENKGVLQSKTRGKIKAYSLRDTEMAKEYLILVEQYKLLTFLEEHPLIKEIVAKIQEHIKGIGVIFGSYAKGLEKKSSDLDIFIAGEYNGEEVKKISKTYGLDLNVKQYPLKEFKKAIREDILIKEVLENHVIFLYPEALIKRMLKYG